MIKTTRNGVVPTGDRILARPVEKRRRKYAFSVLLLLVATTSYVPAFAQGAGDPNPRAILEQSASAMGGQAPADSEAKGTIEITLGSTTDAGDLRVTTRALEQTKEEIIIPGKSKVTTYSGGHASTRQGETARRLHRELAVTCQSSNFPLVLINSILADSDSEYEYLGLENLDGSQAHHVRVRDTYLSEPGLRDLAEFDVTDLWIDAGTSLPLKAAYDHAGGGGSAPRIPVEVFYRDYRRVTDILYPFALKKTYNGSDWQVVTIGAVRFGVGLTDNDFSLE